MLFLFKTLSNFLKLLNSETAPSQLAMGLGFGMMVGLTPLTSLHNLVLLFIVFLFRINLSMFFLGLAVFALLSFALDPLFNVIGYWALVDLHWARPFWIEITSGAIWPFFRFNNTIVMGSLLVSLALFIPLILFSLRGIHIYRISWREKIRESRFVKALKATALYSLYEKYESMKEKLSVIS